MVTSKKGRKKCFAVLGNLEKGNNNKDMCYDRQSVMGNLLCLNHHVFFKKQSGEHPVAVGYHFFP